MKEADPDGGLFPNFTRNLGQSMTQETKLLFDSLVREDRSILDLLTADYTFVDEVLAKHYGIPNVTGAAFRRVPVTDPNRRGLLGHASVLTLTSLATRTSPVLRGKYVMEVLLGVAPPPPPADVPPLAENVENEKPLPVRERLATHRASAACAACHNMMDPIGLALENFDAVGVWRGTDSGAPVDPSGQLFDGTPLDGPVEPAHGGAGAHRLVRHHLRRELPELRPRPAARSARHADGAGDRPRRRRAPTTSSRAS